MPEKTKELPLYFKLYQLIKELNIVTKNFPKHQKYTLGNQIVEMAWNCIDAFIEANNLPTYQKKEKIVELSNNFDKLKVRIRMAQELDLISVRQFSRIQSEYADEAGSMIGGWLKWAGERGQ